MPPVIPDRWTAYKPCGTVIEGTKLICFKVPLKKTVQMGKVDKDGIWDIPTLLKRIPNLGAVIDLTNTCRYYSPQDLISAGVLHRKILIPGRMIPPEHKVIEFMDTVDDFLGRIGDQVIGVHCTHGLNRTGYMVGRFMRDRMQIPPKVVIKRFERARGYQIERENYVADLLGCPQVPPPHLGPHTQVKPIDSGGEHSVHHRGYGSDSRHKRRYSHNDHNGSLKMSSTSGSSNSKDSYSKRRRNRERPNLHLDKTERLRSTSDLNPRNDGPA